MTGNCETILKTKKKSKIVNQNNRKEKKQSKEKQNKTSTVVDFFSYCFVIGYNFKTN